MSGTIAVKHPAANGAGLVAGALRAFRRAAGTALGRDEAAARGAAREPAPAAVPAAAPGTPRTLRELGLPGILALDLEAAFRQLGMTRGDRVVGYCFRTPEGASYPLRLESLPGGEDLDRVA